MGRKKQFSEEENRKRQIERSKEWQKYNTIKHLEYQKSYYHRNKDKIRERRRIRTNFGYNVTKYVKEWKSYNFTKVAKVDETDDPKRNIFWIYVQNTFPPSSYRYLRLGHATPQLRQTVEKFAPNLYKWNIKAGAGKDGSRSRLTEETKYSLLEDDRRWFEGRDDKPDDKFYMMLNKPSPLEWKLMTKEEKQEFIDNM